MPETNNYPKLHNAMWPGIVGKGTMDAEPIIPLDTLLRLTRDARGPNGEKFDGIDMFITAPHFDIDSDYDAVKKMADHVAGYGLKVGSFVAPIWGGAGGGSAMGSADDRKRFVSQVKKAAPSASRCATSASVRAAASASIPRSASRSGTRTRSATPRRSPRPSARRRRWRRTTASSSSPRARSAGAACIPGARTSTCSRWSACRTSSATRPTWRTRCSSCSAPTPRRTACCRRTSTGRTRLRSMPPTARSPTRCGRGPTISMWRRTTVRPSAPATTPRPDATARSPIRTASSMSPSTRATGSATRRAT